MDFELRKSGQIPAFGNWESANEMPITQYFESARQAGLVRTSASSGVDCDKCPISNRNYGAGHYGGGNFYAPADYGGMPPPRGVVYAPAPPPRKSILSQFTRGKLAWQVRAINRRHQQVERKRIVMKVRDVMDIENQYKNQQQVPKKTKSRQQFPHNEKNSGNLAKHVDEVRPATIIVKPVDEDLYKIPPDLIHKSERKRRLGFLSRCLVPPCSA